MRAERLLSIVMLLKSKGRMTAAALAAELEVSERTVLRDIDALSLSGVPVYAERGRAGGFALVPGYRTDLSGLTLEEAIALLSGGGRLDSPAAVRAKRKLEASLPDVHRSQVTQASQRILVRPEGFVRQAQNVDALGALQQAVFEGRRLRLFYRARNADPRMRILDPIGLIVAGDTWYLVAAVDGDERMYRVSRMSDVEVLDEPADRDPHVDLNAVWNRHRAAFRSGFEPLDIVIRCPPEQVDRIPPPIEVVSVTGIPESGEVRVRIRIGDRRRAVRAMWVMRFDIDLAVVEPDWVRAELASKGHTWTENV